MKIQLCPITSEKIEEAIRLGGVLEATVEGTGKDGGSNCASVKLLGDGWNQPLGGGSTDNSNPRGPALRHRMDRADGVGAGKGSGKSGVSPAIASNAKSFKKMDYGRSGHATRSPPFPAGPA